MSKPPYIKKNSLLRYTLFLPDVNEDQEGFSFFDLLDAPQIVPQPDDTNYKGRAEDRIDLLAVTYYNDPVLWKVIALANNLELLPVDLIPGTEIIIPSPRYVLNELPKTPPTRI